MTFYAEWQEIAGDVEGVQIEPQNGKHTPAWPQLNEREQGILTEVCRAAEQIVEELCITGDGPDEGVERRFRIQSSGYVNLGEDDTQPSSVTMTVAETTITQ